MEVNGPEFDKDTLEHGDVRLPEPSGAEKGPSRGKVVFFLTGIGLGLLLLVVGLGLGISRNIWDRLALLPVIIGGGLLAGWVTINFRFLSEMLKNRRVMVGTNAVFMGLLAVVALTLVNFISNRHYRKWDLTRAGIHTLGDKTQRILENMDKEVTVIAFHLARSRTMNEETYLRLKDLLKLYVQESDKLKVEYVQPDVDPEMAQLTIEKYGIDVSYGLMADDVFVVSGQKKKLLKLDDMMEWEYRNPMNPYERRPVAFKGEQLITSAIIEVTEAKAPRIYILAGHGERSISDSKPAGFLDMAGNLKRDNFELEELVGIPNTGVPEDCDCLVVLAPKAKLAPDEINRIERYLQRGGRLLVCLDFAEESGLEGLLGRWGADVGNDIIISQDARTLLGSAAAFIAYNYGQHDITAPFADERYQVAFNFARTVSARQVSATLRATNLVETSAQSFAETDLETMKATTRAEFQEDSDRKGPVSVAVAVEETAPPASEDAAARTKRARMVVFGDADAFSNDLMAAAGLKNLDLFRNSLNWLVERKELIAIDSRPEVRHILAVDDAAKRAVFWLMVVGLPFAVLLLGGVVWALRSYGSRT